MGAPLAYFSPTGKVGKSVLKKTEVFLRIFPHFLFCFALPLRLVLPKPRRVPCMERCGYSEYVPKESEALVHGHIGCVGRLVLVRLRSAPFHYAKDRFPLTARYVTCINCVVERSNQ